MIENKFNILFFPHDSNPEHIKALDGLRGLAILLVLLSHSSNSGLYFIEALNFSKAGKMGVYLFFVLSAYLLDRQIALAIRSKKSSKQYWKNYILRRFLRIYPLFAIALLLHGLLSYFKIRTVIDQPLDIVYHLALLKGESVFWSIPVELKYYFISPLIMLFFHHILKWNIFKLFCCFILLILIPFGLDLHFELAKTSTIKYLPIFLVGTFISIFELTNRPNIEIIRSKYYDIAGLISLIIILVSIPYFFRSLFGFKLDFHSPKFFIPYAILWGVILLSAKYGKGLIRYILELKYLRFFGTISYSMYLFHMLFLKLLKKFTILPSLHIYFFFLLTIVFSCLSYLKIERPLSKIRINH